MSKIDQNIPQPMQPHGVIGRLFGWSMDRLNAPAFRAAKDALAPRSDDAIVEIGFGTGALAAALARAAPHGFVAGVDPSSLMLETAIKRNAKAVRAGRVDLRLGTADHLPWQDRRFDKAAALHSFQFWPDPVRGLGEAARVLKPGGLLIFVMRAHGRGAMDWLPNPISRSSDEIGGTIRALLDAGFAVEQPTSAVGSSTLIRAIRSQSSR